MMGFTYEEIINKIKEEKGISDEDLNKKIKEKLDKLGDLISREGAAHIAANEYGVKLYRNFSKQVLQIGKLMAGMRNISVNGKVIKNYGVRSFKNEKREGKVGTFLIGDETGTLRTVIWDANLIKEMEDGKVSENIVLRLKNGYIKENNGYKEIHLGNNSEIILNPENVSINEVNFTVPSGIKKSISELNAGDNNVSITGTVVEVFEPRFYESCNECGKSAKMNGDGYKCEVHNGAGTTSVPILNMFFDDGTSSIRVTAFREQAKKIYNKIDETKSMDKFLELRDSVVGKQLRILGRVNKNEMFDKTEFVARNVEDVNPIDMAEDLIKGI